MTSTALSFCTSCAVQQRGPLSIAAAPVVKIQSWHRLVPHGLHWAVQAAAVWLRMIISLQGADLQPDGPHAEHHLRLHAPAWLPASAPGWLHACGSAPSGADTSLENRYCSDNAWVLKVVTVLLDAVKLVRYPYIGCSVVNKFPGSTAWQVKLRIWDNRAAAKPVSASSVISCLIICEVCGQKPQLCGRCDTWESVFLIMKRVPGSETGV